MIDELLIRVTFKCNKKCRFCFNNVFEDRVNYDSDNKMDIEKICSFVKRHNVTKVHLSGGEPTMYMDIYSLSKNLSEYTKVSYFTNGMLFKRFTVDEVSNMGISTVKVSLYEDECIPDICRKISDIKRKNPSMKFKASLMIASDFFCVIKSEDYKEAEKVFDNIKWQPLTVPKDNSLYPTTIEAMSSQEREKIFMVLRKYPDNKVYAYEKVLNGEIPKKCFMGKNYLTMNPDMTISICPHLNEVKTLTIEEYEKILDRDFFINPTCRSLRCIQLQAFLERKYGDE